MSTYNNLNYRKMPQQVQKNREDIVTISTLYDDDILALQEKDTEQDGVILDNSDDIEQLQDALAAGGVIVSRRISLLADLTTELAETKIVFDEEVSESNDVAAITKDGNNDTVLITEGKYKIELSSTISNGIGGAETVTFNVYTKDIVTTVETLLQSDVISIGSGETVNKTLQVDYTRLAGNNQIIIVKQLASKDDLTISQNLCNHVTSYFTTAGTGVVTQTRNIAPTTVADEGLAGTETTQAEINEGFKTRHDDVHRAVQGSGNNLLMTNSGLIKNVADPIDNQDVVTKAYFVANPAGTAYTTDNIVTKIVATESPSGTAINQSLINIEVANALNGEVVFENVASPIQYGDNFTITEYLSYKYIEIYVDVTTSNADFRSTHKIYNKPTGQKLTYFNRRLDSVNMNNDYIFIQRTSGSTFKYQYNLIDIVKISDNVSTKTSNSLTNLPIVKIVGYRY